MDILDALDVLEKLPTVPEMAKSCRQEISSLRRQVAALERSNIALESMRPMWAQGWTSDSQAAQASAAALSQIWELLGVDNQTDAMEKLRDLRSGVEMCLEAERERQKRLKPGAPASAYTAERIAKLERVLP